MTPIIFTPSSTSFTIANCKISKISYSGIRENEFWRAHLHFLSSNQDLFFGAYRSVKTIQPCIEFAEPIQITSMTNIELKNLKLEGTDSIFLFST